MPRSASPAPAGARRKSALDVRTALARLEAAGTEQNRKIYRRHGAKDPLHGVSFAVLNALAREAGRDASLARDLWASGNYDARLLACKVADPAAMSEDDLDAWLAEIEVYVLVDVFVGSLAAKVPGVPARADRWSASRRDWSAQAGWDLYGQLALSDPDQDDAFFLGLLERIEAGIRGAGNRTRHSMNGALIAIGMRNPALRAAAESVAARIGPVEVDHGQTGCVTPAAIPYIARAWDRRTTRAGGARAQVAGAGTARAEGARASS
jgi:3-methyladenine DNA glycosylase AlkD